MNNGTTMEGLQYGASVVIWTVELPDPHARLFIAFSCRFLLNLLALASHRLDMAARRVISDCSSFSGWATDPEIARRLAARREVIFMIL